MFRQSARIYDAIYSFKNYDKEVEDICALIADRVGGTLLDVACGTGQHLLRLKSNFTCEGLDLDPGSLEIAAGRLEGVPLHIADMTDFDLGKQFDVVTCLFSAIGYCQTVERLNAALERFALHTKPGGYVLADPWISPDDWKAGHLHCLCVDEPDLKVARMSLPSREGDLSIIQFEYLVLTPSGFERASEEHRLGLFTDAQYRNAFERAGLVTMFLHDALTPRGLYIGKKGL